MKDLSENDLKNNIPLCSVAGEKRPVQVGNTEVGGKTLSVMAGPCTVESRDQVFAIAQAVKAAGATLLRGRRLQTTHLPLRRSPPPF